MIHMKTGHWITMAGVVTLLAGQLAWSDRQADAIEKMQERVQEYRERLNLSDEQVAAIRPILQKSLEDRIAVLKQYGVDAENRSRGDQLSMSDRRAIGGEMKKIRDETNQSLSDILDEQQMKEYLVIAKERQAELRQKMKQQSSQ